MTQRLVLLGAAEGPWCGIGAVKTPTLRIRGLREGVVDVILRARDESTHLLGVSRDGDYCLSDGSVLPVTGPLEWIKVSASKPSKNLICFVQPKVA